VAGCDRDAQAIDETRKHFESGSREKEFDESASVKAGLSEA